MTKRKKSAAFGSLVDVIKSEPGLEIKIPVSRETHLAYLARMRVNLSKLREVVRSRKQTPKAFKMIHVRTDDHETDPSMCYLVVMKQVGSENSALVAELLEDLTL